MLGKLRGNSLGNRRKVTWSCPAVCPVTKKAVMVIGIRYISKTIQSIFRITAAAVYTLLVLVMVTVGIGSNAAFTSFSRLLEGTSLALGNWPRRFQVSTYP